VLCKDRGGDSDAFDTLEQGLDDRGMAGRIVPDLSRDEGVFGRRALDQLETGRTALLRENSGVRRKV
jgi:hypothetical protein